MFGIRQNTKKGVAIHGKGIGKGKGLMNFVKKNSTRFVDSHKLVLENIAVAQHGAF